MELAYAPELSEALKPLLGGGMSDEDAKSVQATLEAKDASLATYKDMASDLQAQLRQLRAELHRAGESLEEQRAAAQEALDGAMITGEPWDPSLSHLTPA